MAGPFNRGDTIIKQALYFTLLLQKMKNWPPPSNPDELWSCVAFAGYYIKIVEVGTRS